MCKHLVSFIIFFTQMTKEGGIDIFWSYND